MKSKRLLAMLLAVAAGLGMYGFETFAAPPATATICFRGNTIIVPFYLRTRYIAAGAYDGPCATS